MSFWDKVSPVYDILQVVNRRPFRAMLERCNAGRMKITRINGFMPAAFVVIRKG